MTEPLQKVDSAVEGVTAPPVKEKKVRASSSVAGVFSPEELRESKTPLEVAVETQRTGWKINTSSSTVEEKEILSKQITSPPVRRIDIHFDTGLTVTARGRTGVTIKDALDAMHKAFKKRSDDELPTPYLVGFEWRGLRKGNTDEDTETEWVRLIPRLSAVPTSTGGGSGGGKKKKNKKEE